MQLESVLNTNRFLKSAKDLKKAVEMEHSKTKPTKKSEESMNTEKLKKIKIRIKTGYYDRPEILEKIAERLIGGEKL